jgi:hypothetical protein
VPAVVEKLAREASDLGRVVGISMVDDGEVGATAPWIRRSPRTSRQFRSIAPQLCLNRKVTVPSSFFTADVSLMW